MENSALDLVRISASIKEKRKIANVTQSELADMCGVSRVTINALENNKIKEIGINRLAKIISVQDQLIKEQTQKSLPRKVQVMRSSAPPLLSFPYNWSNSSMDDTTLIGKVIERGLFPDVATVCIHYGIEKVKAVQEKLIAQGDELPTRIPLMIKNIETASHSLINA